MFLGCAPYSLLIQIHNIACQRNQACVKVPVSGLNGVCGSFTQHKLRFNSAGSRPWDKGRGGGGGFQKNVFGSSGLEAKLCMICDLLALRPISHITKKTLSYLHSTKIEQMTKTMVIFKRGAIFLCCIRCDPIPPQTSVQRLAHTRNVTTCCWSRCYWLSVSYM